MSLIITLLTCFLTMGLIADQSVYRSYHPHYLHSRSFPTPSTLHLYYGRVEATTPIFLIQQGSEGQQTSFYVLDQREDKSFVKTKSLRSYQQKDENLKTMLVFTLQDSYEDNYIQAARIEKTTGKYSFNIVVRNGTDSKAFLIRFTEDDKVIPLGELADKIEINWRNVSGNPKSNWRISRQISWFEFTSAEYTPKTFKVEDNVDFTALVLQVAVDSNLIGKYKVHVDHVELPDTVKTSREEITKYLLAQYDQPATIRNQIDPPLTCEADAIDKLKKGLSYEYGRLHLAHDNAPIPNLPNELLSFSPSKKRFPWGFLWDDGFHNEVVVRSDADISIKVVKSWLNTMMNGWIPRQQDRGIEREELCNCERFLVKDDRDGNPPSLLLPLKYLLKKKELTLERLGADTWDKLKKWHAWFMSTQMVGNETYMFKWFDHIQSEGSFNSGLDDFPRPSNCLYHIDAQSWMYYLSQFMWEASVEFRDPDSGKYEQITRRIHKGLAQFLNPDTQIYSDVSSNSWNIGVLNNLGLNTHGQRLGTPTPNSRRHDLLGEDGSIQFSKLTKQYSDNIGYPSLLPLAFGMIEKDSDPYIEILEQIKSKTKFNTGYGLSSITQDNRLYLASKDSYWRGPVWININYLVLRGLKLYYPEEKEAYNMLRTQLIDTVCGEWKRTGYFYENYIRGTGSFSFPFNGWTSLIALIVSEQY